MSAGALPLPSRCHEPTVILLHAYSRRNRGDGLLVDEAIRIVRSALGSDIRPWVVCADPGSFTELDRRIALPGVDGPRRLTEAIAVALELGLRRAGRRGAGLLQGRLPTNRIDAVIGVGGGYLRAPGGITSLKTAIAHLQQLEWAASSAIPSVYLPQSIGPLRGSIGARIGDRLARLSMVCLRDDRSVVELGGLTNTVRIPDLAVLRLGHELDHRRIAPALRRCYLIARDLPLPASARLGYVQKLLTLRSLLPDIQPLAQSSGRGNDDPVFYRELGWSEPVPSAADIARLEPGVVVSVRLHGSLGAMLAAMPSIHLSYERKGYGAYADLGLSDFVHSSTRFDPAAVAQQVRALQTDADMFWQRVRAARPALRAAEQHLINLVRETCGMHNASHAA